jgi:apolipoprotein N-acyltransferase
MSSQALSAATPRTDLTGTGTPSPRGGTHPAVLGVASGVLLWFAFPPAGWSWLGWIALAPLFLLVPSTRSRLSIYFGAWLGGLAFWLLALNWILCIDPSAALGWAVMAMVLSTLWPLFLAIARVGTQQLKLPLMLAAPIVWVALEYVRAYMFTGFPWYYLAHTQYRQLAFIQIADFSGSLGLSFLMAVSSALVVDILTLPLLRPTPRGPRLTRPIAIRIGSLAVALAATVGYGLYRLNTARFEPGPRVALLQTNFMQRSDSKKRKKAEEILGIYKTLIEKAMKAAPRPDLLVWTETSYPYGFVAIDPQLSADEFARQIRDYDPEGTPAAWATKRSDIAAQLHGWTDAIGIPMMVGSTTYDFRRGGLNRYNSAILFEPEKTTIQSYHKLHLVPFGEYVPLLQTFPWLTALTPYRNGFIPSLAFGGVPAWFREGRYKYATAICFEDTVPQVTRRLFAEVDDGRSPDVLLNLSNDGWFVYEDDKDEIHSSSEHEMHLAGSVFRAVEHRVPLARAANTGISAVIDGNGRVVAALPGAKEDVLVADVPLDPRTGLYTSWGDWVGLSCLAITIGLIPLGLRPRKRGEKQAAA